MAKIKIKTSELIDQALNWAVATAMGRAPVLDMESHGLTWQGWWLSLGGEYVRMPNYVSDGDETMRVIWREWINLDNGSNHHHPHLWCATKYNTEGHPVDGFGPTPLVAVWRCYVASKLGDEVDVPEELV